MTSLNKTRPGVSKHQAIELANRLFGLQIPDSSTVKELNSYDDRNFYMKGWLSKEAKREKGNCKEYTLKILNHDDSTHDCLVEAQNETMLFLKGRGYGCPTPLVSLYNTPFVMCKIPREISSGHVGHVDGIEVYDGEEYCKEEFFLCAVRLLTFVPGRVLNEVPLTTELLYNVGKAVGRLDRDLKDFEFPMLDRSGFLWDLSCVGDTMEQFIEAVSVSRHREMVREVCDAFRSEVVPALNLLPKQLIHGDANYTNIIVDEREKRRGFIDFGDLNYSCRVFELAVSLMYIVNADFDLTLGRVAMAGVVFAGYQSVNPLSDKEIDLLYVLTASRFCQSLVYGAYTAKHFDPGNEYIMQTSENGWKNFEAFWKTPKDEVLKVWLQMSKEMESKGD